MMDVGRIREDFPIFKRLVHGKPLIYFDNAATSQKPRQVIAVLKEFYEKNNANIGRGIHELAINATELYEGARRDIADFIGAKPNELVFVKNSTEGINIVAYALLLSGEIQRGDEILITAMEHHSNILPWVNISKLSQATLKVAEVDREGLLDMYDFERKLSEKTKIVAITHVSNVTGVINNVKKICKLAHSVGAYCLVDGAQSVPHLPVNVKSIGTDFLVFSGHKMLGPMGIGGLYVREEILEKLAPPFPGGGAISNVVCSDELCSAEWLKPPSKFEAGTPNVAGALGLAEAVRYLRRIGMDNVMGHEKELTKYMLDRLSELDSVVVYGPRDPGIKSGVISFNVVGIAPHDLASLLDFEGIAVRSGHHCALPLIKRLNAEPGTVRASFYIYNTKEEIDKFIDVLNRVSRMTRI